MAIALTRAGGPGLIRSAALPVAILLLVVLMVVPIPAALLDLFFIMNITISLAVLMVSLNAQKP
ncbi:MAG: FHIPEP family type III secretion protein, partial [Sphingomonas sp.]